ncbi:unnamed protein product, partial [Adineta steineri]
MCIFVFFPTKSRHGNVASNIGLFEDSGFSSENNSSSFACIPNFATQQSPTGFEELIPNQNVTSAQSLNNIEIFVQPKPDQRPCNPSDLKDKSPRYIQGLKKIEKEIIYKYPAIQIPDWCRTQNKLRYIHVTLTTVELQDGKRFIHPNKLQKPATEKHEWTDCENGTHVAEVQIAPIIPTLTSTPIFHDEFLRDGPIDLNKWEFLEGTGENGWGTHQQQYYRNMDKNAHCEGNRLIIEARRENYKGSKYTSARLRSKQTFLYGKLE